MKSVGIKELCWNSCFLAGLRNLPAGNTHEADADDAAEAYDDADDAAEAYDNADDEIL